MTEQIERERQIVGLLYLGTAITGLVDAISYVGLGHVFTANMTGNVVLLGFAVAGTAGLSVSRSLTALAAFMAGALMGGRIAATLEPQSVHRWRITAIATESTFLLVATLVSLGHRPLLNDSIALYAVITFTALAMGMRNATVRKIGQPDLTTTVLTLTITGLAADSSVAGGNNPRWQRRLLSIGVDVLWSCCRRSVSETLSRPAARSSNGCDGQRRYIALPHARGVWGEY